MLLLQGGNLSLFDKFLDHKMETLGERQVPINGIHGAKNASVYSVNRDQAHDYQSSLMILSALRNVVRGEAASQVSVDAIATTMHLLNHLQASQQVIPHTNTTTHPKILITIERVQRHDPLGCV
jgi:5-enolpyruvylshikimate-3-phosphate synthase